MARETYDKGIIRDLPDQVIKWHRACLADNHRNGTSPKSVDIGSERLVLEIPHDRPGNGMLPGPNLPSSLESASSLTSDINPAHTHRIPEGPASL